MIYINIATPFSNLFVKKKKETVINGYGKVLVLYTVI